MCVVAGCGRDQLTREMCKRHYTRWLRYGDPLAGRGIQGLSTIDRFWQYVGKAEKGECWRWRGPLSRGYGNLTDGNHRGAPRIRAHVFSWRLHNGMTEVPVGQVIRHLCGNPPCTNPDHLLAGTQAQNMQDMIRHRRSTRGERDAMAKLNRTDIDQIRASLATGERHEDIAGRFGVSRSAISLIASGKRWGWYVSPAVAQGYESATVA